jgi:hypothetical protein
MPIRSLNGLDYSVRSLNGLSNVIDYSVSLPLTMDSNYNIKLSNLTTYGTANQILKMNSGGTALEYASETDTTYTVSLPLTLSAQNKIGLAGLTSYGNDNQILRMNGTNSIEWSNEQDISGFITTVTLPNLVSALTTFGSDSAGLTNFGATNHSTNLYGNVTIKNITTVNNGNIYVYGSGGLITASTYSYSFPVGGGTLVSSNTIVSSVSVLNNFGTLAISNVSVGKATLDTLLYGNVKIQNISSVSSGNIFICGTNNIINKSTQSYTLPSSSGTLALTSDIPSFVNYFAKTNNDIRPINLTDNLLLGTTTNSNSRKFVVNGLMDIQGSIFFTTGGGHIFNSNGHGILGRTGAGETDIGTSQSPSLIQGSTSTTFKGSSNVVQIESTLRFMNSGGMLRNSQGNALISFDSTPNLEKNIFGISANITEILGSTTLYSNPIETNSLISFTADGALLTNPNFNPIVTYSSTNPIFMYNTFGNIMERTTILGQGTILLGGPTCGLEITNEFKVNDGIYDIMRLGNGTTNLLGHMSFNTHLVGADIELGTAGNANNNCYIRSANLVVTYHNSGNLLYKAGINSNRYQITCNAIEGVLYPPSDDRIKFNETPLTNALDTINKLKPVKYDKKYNKDLYETLYGVEMEHAIPDIAQVEFGYIAQDTYNDIPELKFCVGGVDESIPENFDENGKLIEDCKIRTTNLEGEEFIDRKYLSIEYNSINVLNVKAVQELYVIVRQQQEQINKQQEQINILINQINI